MNDRFQRGARLVIAKDDAAERGTIQGAVGGEDARPEAGGDGGETGGARRDRLPRQDVGVDGRDAMGGESFEAVGLPRRDSSG
jgi:hypothetical protein